MNKIEAENLRFRYQKSDKDALNGLSLSCRCGTVTVILGLNGSGKTTLIKCLAGIIRPNSGKILLDGHPIGDYSVKERAGILSYVAQRTGIIEDFKVRDYLLFGMVSQFRFYESLKQADEDEADEIAERFGITKLLEKKLCEISGGERQIVSICAALLQKTDMIILDEPTSALDIKNQSTVLSALKKIAREGKTIVLSSHNPNHALYLDADVLLMDNGSAVSYGKASDIIKPEILSTVYGSCVSYSTDLRYKEISFI